MTARPAAIEAHEIVFAYRRGLAPVIENLTAVLPTGAVTAVTGASGSGKSTLLYVLALLLRPQAGRIAWAGRSVSGTSDRERSRLRAERTGFVFQDAMLDPARSVLDSVCESALYAGLPTAEAVSRAHQLLERFGVEHRAGHRPGEISGGQAQRVALCRALLTHPTLIFADEPTGNLDAATADLVWGALAEHAASGGTVVVATHDQELVRRSDERIVLA